MKTRMVFIVLATFCLVFAAGSSGVAADVVRSTATPDETIIILPETLPPATVGILYKQQLTATGGNPASYQWWLSSAGADLPPCWVGTTGQFECDKWQLAQGSYTFTIHVIDSNMVQGSREYTLVVYPALTLGPATLPNGKVGQAYSQAITVGSGLAPYTMTGSNLPAGLAITGPHLDAGPGSFTLEGTPTTSGVYDVDIKAWDANGAQGSAFYRLWIAPARGFTWSPEQPVQRQAVTFTTTVPEYTTCGWYRGLTPGASCDIGAFADANGPSAQFTFYSIGTYEMCLMCVVGDIGYVTDRQSITVGNAAPGIYLNVSPEPSLVGEQISGSIGVYDATEDGPFSCRIDWGDGTPPVTAVPAGSSTCSFPPHTYAAAGAYTITGWAADKYTEGAATITHNVAYVRVDSSAASWLADNVVPTTVELVAYAPAGTTSLNFAIADQPAQGSVAVPVSTGCRPLAYGSGMLANRSGTAASGESAQLPLAALDSATGRLRPEPAAPAAPVAQGAAAIQECTANVLYTPPAALFTGDASFTVTASDGAGNTSLPGTISLWVSPNSPPVAQDSSAIVSGGGATTLVLTATDPDQHDITTDRLTFTIDGGPAGGSLQPVGEPACARRFGQSGVTCTFSVSYTPNPGATTDSFTFHVNDSHRDSNVATVSLTVHTPATLHVNTVDDAVDAAGCDETHCSLREAVNKASLGDTIDFTLGTPPNTIVLGGREILIDKDVTISGPGADQLAISGGAPPEALPGAGFGRIFLIYDATEERPFNVKISGLTIRDGRQIFGAGLVVGPNVTVTLNDCVIGPNNVVSYAGGGIANQDGHLTLNRCTVVGNSGTGTLGGAGIVVAGPNASTTLVNTTVSGNVTNNHGGAIYAAYGASVNLIQSTVTANTANNNYAIEPWGGVGGIFVAPEAHVTLQNSIVAGNIDKTSLTSPLDHTPYPDVYGAFDSAGGNLVGEGTGSTGWMAGDVVGTAAAPVDPKLAALALNAPGHTPTHALLDVSPAINAVACVEGISTDQRGATRPDGLYCDTGAYEVEKPPVFAITGATADGVAMAGDLDSGYILPTTNDAGVDHLIQFASGTSANEPLADAYFPLNLTSSTVGKDELKAYYDRRGVPEPYLSYLKDAVDGNKPFVYIKGSTVKLVDAAKHDLGSVDVDMTVPDNYPLGAYTVKGSIEDVAGNATEVQLILIVSGNRMSVQGVTVTVAKIASRYRASAVTTIVYADGSGVRVNRAVVDGEWRLAPIVTAQATTNKKGAASFPRQPVDVGTGYEFCVTGLTKTGYSWQPGLNDCATFSVQ